jgi:hypothetical protein
MFYPPYQSEYFARFTFSRGLGCTLEVLAPTLSAVPIAVRPAVHQSEIGQAPTSHATNKTSSSKKRSKKDEAPSELEDARQAVRKAVELYLQTPVELKNVAHSVVPIRFGRANGSGQGKEEEDRPTLEVDLVLHSLDGADDDVADDDDIEQEEEEECLDEVKTPLRHEETDAGNLVLIRMVNRVPLLDTSEAIACGFVQGVANKKRLWSSFGLTVAHETCASSNDGAEGSGSDIKLQRYSVRDSDQVAPFFQQGSHAKFEEEPNEAGENSDDEQSHGGSDYDRTHVRSVAVRGKRKRGGGPRRPHLLPAKVRLAQCILVLHIHAKPSTLPLPTLSKVRKITLLHLNCH